MSRSTIKAAFDNIGEQELPLSITPTTISNALNALLNEAVLQSEQADALEQKANAADVEAALALKADSEHTHSAIGDEDSSVTVGEGEINIELSDPVTHSGGELNITVSKLPNLQRAINNPDSTPTANSNNLVTSGGVKAAIDALLTNRIPIHQFVAILPKTVGADSAYEIHSWLEDGKMAMVLQTARPVTVNIEALGVDDAPDATWRGSTDISFDLAPGARTVKNIYDLISAQLQYDYPDERIGFITDWKICVIAKDTVSADTVCLINFYNPTSAE